jgi:hypothetical protein
MGYADVRCPYGQPGDRLWVRETWRTQRHFHNFKPSELHSNKFGNVLKPRIWYEENIQGWQNALAEHNAEIKGNASGMRVIMVHRDSPEANEGRSLLAWGRKRPSIHMPRWASRITLEITGVRVERVGEITELDAMSEGAERPQLSPDNIDGHPVHPMTGPYLEGFRLLWDSINAKRGYGWTVNPWVWVIEFKRLEVTP